MKGLVLNMSNRLFQTVIHQMKDAIDRTIGVIDENYTVIACSDLGKIGETHEVMFAGEDEIITITHSARSKRVFAVGAIRAAKFLVQKMAGMYEMKDLLAEENA